MTVAELSEKELSFLEDQLAAEQLLIKKYQTIAAQAQDGELRTCCQQIAGRHQQHFNTMMNYLN